MKTSNRTLISILVLIVFSLLAFACGAKQTSAEIANQLKGNTYEFELTEKSLNRTIHFNDSTFTVYESFSSNSIWGAPHEEKCKLILDGQIVELRKKNKSIYTGVIKGDNDIPFILRKRVPNWSIESIKGDWMFERVYQDKAMDEKFGNVEPENRIDLYSVPTGMTKNDFVYYPYLRILKNQIIYKQNYDSIISNFEVIEQEDFMALKLDNPDPFKANYIKILAQNDTLVCYHFVDRIEQVDDTTQYGTPKLYKIR